MDIFFQDPTEIPLPPEEVRIKKLTAEPWEDGRRIRVNVELTPFQKRPNGEIKVLNSAGEETANVSFIETIDPKMQFTMHLRTPETLGDYSVTATVFYPKFDNGPAAGESHDQETMSLSIPIETMVVDQATTTFKIPPSSESSPP